MVYIFLHQWKLLTLSLVCDKSPEQKSKQNRSIKPQHDTRNGAENYFLSCWSIRGTTSVELKNQRKHLWLKTETKHEWKVWRTENRLMQTKDMSALNRQMLVISAKCDAVKTCSQWKMAEAAQRGGSDPKSVLSDPITAVSFKYRPRFEIRSLRPCSVCLS